MRRLPGFGHARANRIPGSEDYPCFGVAEGGPNALAILGHAWASEVETRIAPICMPSSLRISGSSLAHLQGKRGRIFIDNDAPGHEAANRWATQLASADITVDGFSFAGFLTTDGQPVKDLNDLSYIDYDCWEEFRNRIESIMDFTP